jgi:hypothetical protein
LGKHAGREGGRCGVTIKLGASEFLILFAICCALLSISAQLWRITIVLGAIAK